MAKDFVHRGVPLNGIGFQAHVDLSFDNAAKLASFRSNLQRFADLGLEIHITELDIRLSSDAREQLEAQAALYGKIVRACLENRAPTSTRGFRRSFPDTVGRSPGTRIT